MGKEIRISQPASLKEIASHALWEPVAKEAGFAVHLFIRALTQGGDRAVEKAIVKPEFSKITSASDHAHHFSEQRTARDT